MFRVKAGCLSFFATSEAETGAQNRPRGLEDVFRIVVEENDAARDLRSISCNLEKPDASVEPELDTVAD